jgi:hypothetical protein
VNFFDHHLSFFNWKIRDECSAPLGNCAKSVLQALVTAQHCFAALQKEKAKISSAFEKADTSGANISFSPFDKGARNFHLQHPNWFLNWQIKKRGTL